MPADVEAVALVLIGPADPPDEVRVGFEDDAGVAVLGEFISGGQSGGSAAGDDRVEGRDHRLVDR